MYVREGLIFKELAQVIVEDWWMVSLKPQERNKKATGLSQELHFESKGSLWKN